MLSTYHPTGRQRGFALVVTLSIIVIVTLLVVSFTSLMRLELQATGSYTASYGANELAQGACDTLLSALRQEIRSRSTVVAVGGKDIFLPPDAASIPPEVTIPPADRSALPTVLRVSGGSTTLGKFPATLEAGGGPSNTSGSGGRPVSTSRWSAPRLFVSGNAGKLPAPEWIYWTADGPAKTPAAADVVGRIAYVGYNVGGLLNANVAGYPTGTGAPTTAEIGRKGSTALADLQVLPGFSDTLADTLARWREALPLTSTWFLQMQEFRNNGASDIRSGGNAFLNRQELIRYTNSVLSLGSHPDALSYLTVGSTFNQAPAFIPDPNRPRLGDSGVSNDNAAGTASRTLTKGRDDEFNPRLPTLVWDQDRAVNVGSDYEFNVKKGDPFVTRRFDLNLLKLLDDPAKNAAAIRLRFGLEWEAERQWKYVNNSVNRFRTLAELQTAITNGTVPAREPDFFEMLQAAIPLGSLGRDGGVGTVQTVAGEAGEKIIINRDQNPFLQIMGIGANIIDQADTDSFPTEIQMPLNPDVNVCQGIENLPYLQRVIYYVGRLASPNDTQLGGWLLFELWNPHQNPPASGAVGTIPSELRIIARGNVNFMTESTRTITPAVSFWPKRFDANAFTAGTAPTDSLTINMQAFAEPTLLNATNVASFTTQHAGIKDYNDKIRGLYVGRNTVDQMEFVSERRVSLHQIAPNSALDIYLQYRTNTGWRTYDRLENIADGGFVTHQGPGDGRGILLSGGAETYDGDNLHRYFANQRTDPRTDRFGALQRYAKYDNTGKDRAAGFSMRPELSGEAYLLCFNGNKYDRNSGFIRNIDASDPTNDWSYPGSLAENFTLPGAGVANNRVTYVHPDGVRRRADSAYLGAGVAEGQPMRAGNTNSRPLILNRPFRSVGELGYVFRGEPWATLSFWTRESGDGPLLEYFTVGGTERTADALDLNTAPREVLQALLAGSMMRESNNPAGSDLITAGERDRMADAIIAARPFSSRTDLVTKLSDPLTTALSGNANQRIKNRREAVVRALADVANFRTWNLVFDVVAQTGVIPPGQPVNRFVTRGERRLWMHVSIDRYTGEVLNSHLEEVYE